MGEASYVVARNRLATDWGSGLNVQQQTAEALCLRVVYPADRLLVSVNNCFT